MMVVSERCCNSVNLRCWHAVVRTAMAVKIIFFMMIGSYCCVAICAMVAAS